MKKPVTRLFTGFVYFRGIHITVKAMSSAGFRSTYLSAYNQSLCFIQSYQFTSNPRIAYLANVMGWYFILFQ